MHRTFSIGAVDEGEVCYRVGNQHASLSIGSLALVNPDTLHSCNSVNSEGRSFYMLYLDVDWCSRVQKSLWQIDSFTAAEAIRLDDVGLYHRYCTVMRYLMDEGTEMAGKEQILVDFVSSVFERICKPQSKRISRSENIEQVKKILSENLSGDLTLNSLANHLNANPYTLLRRFKAATGITPHAYRLNCRIEQARKYLQQGMAISETALECGFFDQSHLHRHFKAMTTVTPQEYRVNFIQ